MESPESGFLSVLQRWRRPQVEALNEDLERQLGDIVASLEVVASREAIRNGRLWIEANAEHASSIGGSLVNRIVHLPAVSHRIHVLFLLHDVFQTEVSREDISARRSLCEAMKPFLVWILRPSYQLAQHVAPDGEDAMKILMLLQLWGERGLVCAHEAEEMRQVVVAQEFNLDEGAEEEDDSDAAEVRAFMSEFPGEAFERRVRELLAEQLAAVQTVFSASEEDILRILEAQRAALARQMEAEWKRLRGQNRRLRGELAAAGLGSPSLPMDGGTGGCSSLDSSRRHRARPPLGLNLVRSTNRAGTPPSSLKSLVSPQEPKLFALGSYPKVPPPSFDVPSPWEASTPRTSRGSPFPPEAVAPAHLPPPESSPTPPQPLSVLVDVPLPEDRVPHLVVQKKEIPESQLPGAVDSSSSHEVPPAPALQRCLSPSGMPRTSPRCEAERDSLSSSHSPYLNMVVRIQPESPHVHHSGSSVTPYCSKNEQDGSWNTAPALHTFGAKNDCQETSRENCSSEITPLASVHSDISENEDPRNTMCSKMKRRRQSAMVLHNLQNQDRKRLKNGRVGGSDEFQDFQGVLFSAVSGAVIGMQKSDEGDGDDGKKKHVFVDAAAMKERVRQAIGKTEYNVCNLYKDVGVCQRVARSQFFEHGTLIVIALNALWLSIDTDKNKSPVLLQADLIFQVVEFAFCAYFFWEWSIRFAAFKTKRYAFTDRWFVFDSWLVIMMLLETVVMSIFLHFSTGAQTAGGGIMANAQVLRLVKLLRLTRMARMARLLRAMPELMILVKGMVVATRSVFFTLCLLVLILYVFGITFTQVTGDTEVGEIYFSTVANSMNTLLLYGCFGEDLPDVVNAVGAEHFFLAALLLLFVLLASLTVMNMLVGVLVEVVSVVSAVEKEELVVNFVKTQLQDLLKKLGWMEEADGGDIQITKTEFQTLLATPEAARCLQGVGVDVVGLVDFEDLIFQDNDKISFCSFMETVLQLRGSNAATVKDIVDLRKSLMQVVWHVESKIVALQSNLAGNTDGSDKKESKDACRELGTFWG
eukprot:TRINITY_DN4222_c0_g2_i2.p1 TRINITY_DN4222_c0_g2~~TRINITY_DN4222_c0_g2_i2.p1  ORF type:complete len:1039 (+),score=228.95 TRINITY_DN4222_c0_g2_i2:49-3165(+)